LLLSSPISVISKPHAGTEAHGMIFVKNVSDAYELGTKRRGEAVLST
jgi:nitrogen regulatory protein PII